MPKRATIYDIADALGVSVGSVHRALNDRPGVSAVTRQRVLQMAEKLGYKPNLAAKYLSTGRDLRICVNLPASPKSFYDPVRAGIEDEADPFRVAGVSLKFRRFERLGVGELEAFEAALDEKPDGIILTPGAPASLKSLMRRAGRAGVPVVCVINDAPGPGKLTTVSVDTTASGALAAELIARVLTHCGRVAISTGDLSVADHREKYDAFVSVMKSMFPEIQLFPPIENHESADEAYRKTQQFLDDHKYLDGLYISTGNGEAVLQALDESGRWDRVRVIATNLYPELADNMRQKRSVIAAIYERPYSQGRIAFRTLHEFLLQKKAPAARLMLDPVLVMRSNLDRVLSRAGLSGATKDNPNTMVDFVDSRE